MLHILSRTFAPTANVAVDVVMYLHSSPPACLASVRKRQTQNQNVIVLHLNEALDWNHNLIKCAIPNTFVHLCEPSSLWRLMNS